MKENKKQTDELLDISALDEMQKLENYKIGFKMFTVSLIVWILISFATIGFGAARYNDDVVMIGEISFCIIALLYILYAVLASSKGVMNMKFAKEYSKPGVAVMWITVAITNILLDIIPFMIALVMVLFYLALYLCAKRNMKVLEKQLKDDEENDE